MTTLSWPSGIKAPARYTEGRAPSEVMAAGIGAMIDRLVRWQKRTMTFEWANMANREFAQLDALVDLIGAGTIKVPWRTYQDMLGSGTGNPTVSGAHSAGDTTLATTGWTGTDPRVTFGDKIQIGTTVPRVHTVMAAANGATPTITIFPGLWEDVAAGTAIHHLGNAHADGFSEFLVDTMEIASLADVAGEVDLGPKPQTGRGFILTFVTAVRPGY